MVKSGWRFSFVCRFKHPSLVFLILFCTSTLYSQPFTVSGYVMDSITSEPLPFVNILINDVQMGTMTDINGYFTLNHKEPVYKLRLSYMGYQSLEYTLISNRPLKIKLNKLFIPLAEVTIVAGENPAHRIIRNVLNHKSLNDPKNYRNYKFTAYDKSVYKVIVDSVTGNKLLAKGDSTMLKIQKVMNKQHAFLVETVAEQQYINPENYYNRILATKASGFKDPSLFLLISESQPESFYDEVIKLGLKSYINPVSPNFDKLYNFYLRDTIIGESGQDTTYIISFTIAKGRTFNALSGVLYINTHKWAISNVIAQPVTVADGLGYELQQQYDLINDSLWFPVQLNIIVTINNFLFKPYIPIITGKSYRSDILINSNEILKNKDHLTIEVEPDAIYRDDDYWDNYRTDSLNLHDRNTYNVFDSLVGTGKLDFINTINSLVKGYFPLGLINLNLNRLFRYNQYEKNYFGIGLFTSDQLTEAGSLGGYIGYGIGDKAVKYGGNLRINLKKYDRFYIKLEYNNYLEESGSIRYLLSGMNPLSVTNYRSSYTDKFDKVEAIDLSTGFRILKFITAEAGIRQATKRPMYGYRWMSNINTEQIPFPENNFGYLIVNTRFAYRERLVRAGNSEITMGTKFPVLMLQYTSSFKGFLNGEYSYEKIDFRLSYSKFTRLFGQSSLSLQGGAVSTAVPYSELYSALGSSNKAFLGILSKGSFVTMLPSEFLNDRYISVFGKHNFGKLWVNTGKMEPEFSIHINAGIGSLQHPEHHVMHELKTMEHGFYETGLMVDHFFKHTFSTVGFGVFYRLGAYSYDDPVSNIMLKIGLVYD